MSCMSIVGSHFRSLIQIFSNDILWNQNVLQVVDVFAEGGHDMTCEGGHDTWTDALSASVCTKCWARRRGANLLMPFCDELSLHPSLHNCNHVNISSLRSNYLNIVRDSSQGSNNNCVPASTHAELSFLFSNNWKKGNKNSMLKRRHFVMHALSQV